MRRLRAIQKCKSTAVSQRHFFGCGGRRGAFLIAFIFFSCISTFGQSGVTITSTASSPTQQNPVPVTFKFLEPISGFELDDVNVTGGALNNFFIQTPNYFHSGFSKRLSTFELDALNPDISKAAKAILAIDIDAQGMTYALTFNDGIHFFDSSGNAVSGNPQISKEELSDPRDLAIGPDGTIYVADSGNDRIVSIAPNKSISYLGQDILKAPSGLAVDSDGNVYVADTENNRVVVFYPDNQSPKIVNGTGGQALLNPIRLAVDSKGFIYVNDLGKSRIQIFDPSGSYSRTITQGSNTFSSAGSIVVDDYGFIYIADFGSVGLEVFLNYEEVDPLELAPILLGEQLSIKVFNSADLSAAKFSITENVDIPVDIALKPCGYLAINNGDAVLGKYEVKSINPFKAVWPVTFLFDLRLYNRLPDTFTANLNITAQCIPATIFVPAAVGVNKDCQPIPAQSGEFSMIWDDTDPLINCPVEATVISADADQLYRIPDFRNLVTDNCDAEVEIIQDPAPNTPVTAAGSISLTATDAAGNTRTCSIAYDLEDEPQSPNFNCLSNYTIYLDDNGEANLKAEQLVEGDTEGVIFELSKENFSCSDIGNQSVTLRYTGIVNGTCQVQITIEDKGKPEAVCLGNYNVPLKPGETKTLSGADLDAGSYDSCDGFDLEFTLSQYTFSEADEGPNTIVFTAIDQSGNEDECTVNIQVTVEEEPTALEIFCPTDRTLDLEGACSTALPDYTTFATYTEGAVVHQSPAPNSMVSENTTVTLTATLDGETETCFFEVELINFSEILLYCLQDPTVEPDGDGNYILEDYMRQVNTDGACGALTYTQDPVPGTSVSEDTEITLTVTDEKGNSDDCSFTVKLKEADPGTIDCKPIELFLDSEGLATLTGRDLYAGDPEDPAIENLTVNKEEFTCDDLGTQTVTLTAHFTDGSTQTCDAQVTISDDFSPEIYCIAPGKEYALVNGSVTIEVADLVAQEDDNCGIVDLWLSQETFTSSGTKSVTVFAEDASGNIESCTTTIEIFEPSTTPGSCKPAIVYLDASGNATLEPEEVFDGDPSDPEIVDMEVDKESFTCDDLGEPVQVILTVYYSNGTSTSCTASVIVKDDIAPEVVCVEEFTLYLNESGVGMVTPEIIDRGSSDNCGFLRMSLSRQNFGTNDVGQQEVTLTVTDGSGNSSTCTAIINVVAYDPESPGLTCVESLTLPVDEAGNLQLKLNYTGGNENEHYELSKEYFSCDDLGTHPVTVTYWGEHTGTCEIEVTVVDETPPLITCLPEMEVRLNAAGNASISPAELNLEYSDNCSVADTSLSRTSFTTADIGVNEVIFTVTDGSGNTSTCTTTVNVIPFNEGETEPFECVDLHVMEIGENGRAVLNPRDLFTGGSGTVQFEVSKDTFTCNDLGENTVTFNYTTPTGEGSCEIRIRVEDPLNNCGEPVEPGNGDYIILYPNPGDGIVQFQTSPGLEIHRVEVFDMRGRFLFEKIYNSVTIFDKKLDLREYQSGVYSILIFTNGREYLKRAIIRN